MRIFFCCFRKMPYLCTRKSEIGVWCNGNTTDSGPVILGSSPSTPTLKVAKLLKIKHLAIFLFRFWRTFGGFFLLSAKKWGKKLLLSDGFFNFADEPKLILLWQN